MKNDQFYYEEKLRSFNQEIRMNALKSLKVMLDSGEVAIVPELPIVNLHCHTFFSFNAYGYSPSAFAWEAKKRKMPILVGTEMNKHGQKFIDDFNADELKPLRDDFLKGAKIMHGHTLLNKYLGFGLISEAVREKFKDDLATRNDFFESIGCLKPVYDLDKKNELENRIKREWEMA